MALVSHAHTNAPAQIAGRAAPVCSAVQVLRAVPVVRQHNAGIRAFGTARPQRRMSLQVQAQAVSDAIAAPVAEVVKRLQGKVYLAGVSGQLASRVAKELIQTGVQVVAGVPEGDPADGALDFALQFELITKSEAKALTIQEVDFADPDSFGIPRGATVVVVQGDQQGRRKMDAKLVSQAVDAAIEANAARIVLASPLGGGGGGGFLGGLFSGGGGSVSTGSGNLQLSRPEQQVYNSGLPFSIVRYGAPGDSLTPAGNVALTPAGETSKSAQLSGSQAAKAVAEVLQQTPAGTNVVLEAGVSEAAVATPIAFAVAEVLPQAEITEEEEEEEEEAPAPARPSPARRAVQQASQAAEDTAEEAEEQAESAGFGLKSLFGGSRPKQVVEEVEEEVEEVTQQAAKPFASLFGGKPRQAARQAEDAAAEVAKPKTRWGRRSKQAVEDAKEEVEEVAQKAAKPFASLFGGKPRQAAEEAEEVAKPKTRWGRKPKEAQQEVQRGTRQVKQKGREAVSAASRGAKQVKRQAQEAAPRQQGGGVFRSLLGLDEGKEEEEEEEDTGRRGLFGLGGTRKVAASQRPDKRVARAARTAPKQVARGAKSAAKNAEKTAEKKSGGFLSALGIGQDTVYADED